MLPIMLQQCAIMARSPLDVFCGALQELHECLALVVEEGNLFSIAQEILEEIRKDL